MELLSTCSSMQDDSCSRRTNPERQSASAPLMGLTHRTPRLSGYLPDERRSLSPRVALRSSLAIIRCLLIRSLSRDLLILCVPTSDRSSSSSSSSLQPSGGKDPLSPV
ncbi:hypothetical protein EYF80_010826 [Liparis tanakae]|uniref:Uncharacterized protein n=1 Tax=Liparis tanakae TaxID=230148 RepID=A0A4Z2ILG5_9TELE|nr:hypothetical protein EYF80_010826 [Liparis tanakae]